MGWKRPWRVFVALFVGSECVVVAVGDLGIGQIRRHIGDANLAGNK